MLVHIGAGCLVKDSDVIGIFDLDGETTPLITTEFLKNAQKKHETHSAGSDLPRSFVLCSGKGKKVILSHISSPSLYRRCIKKDI